MGPGSGLTPLVTQPRGKKVKVSYSYASALVVTYEKDPLYDRNDPRALGQVEEALRNDGGGEAAVRVIQALAIADEMLISEGAAKAAAAAVRERPTDPAQVVRVWYFRSCH
jgi:hypothetical protein